MSIFILLLMLSILGISGSRRETELDDAYPEANGARFTDALKGAASAAGTRLLPPLPKNDFSGVYAPDTKGSGQAEDFAASFFISEKQFVESFSTIHSATNMAGVSFAVVRRRSLQTLMSRDYFDLMVEHLSTTSNQLPHKSLFSVYNSKMRKTAQRLKELATRRPLWGSSSAETDPRLNQTVAVLVYSSITFSRAQSPLQSKIREWFFAATFWSVYRYFKHVAVYVGKKAHATVCYARAGGLSAHACRILS